MMKLVVYFLVLIVIPVIVYFYQSYAIDKIDSKMKDINWIKITVKFDANNGRTFLTKSFDEYIKNITNIKKSVKVTMWIYSGAMVFVMLWLIFFFFVAAAGSIGNIFFGVFFSKIINSEKMSNIFNHGEVVLTFLLSTLTASQLFMTLFDINPFADRAKIYKLEMEFSESERDLERYLRKKHFEERKDVISVEEGQPENDVFPLLLSIPDREGFKMD